MLSFYLEAPFAVFRSFSAGWYRPTATFLSPSAAYGLSLNVAGIETRLREESNEHNGKTPASLTRTGLPSARIAVGAVATDNGLSPFPIVQTVFQQLHNYPVGRDAGMPKVLTKGNKNNITPVRREVLSDLRAVVCLDTDERTESLIRDGLAGTRNDERYGLPFLGDNQFLIDRLEETLPIPAHWYEIVSSASGSKIKPRATRMTAWIDRSDASRTITHLYAPTTDAVEEIPDSAWTTINPGK